MYLHRPMKKTQAKGENGTSRERQLMALANATSGTIGSLAALLSFYPLDVKKTKTQCFTDEDDQTRNVKIVSWCAILFRGLNYKVAHTVLSSFIYFYVHSMLTSTTFAETFCSPSATTTQGIRQLYPAAELLLSSLAAMVNTVLTLPLDVMSTRAQHQQDDKTSSMIPSSKSNGTAMLGTTTNNTSSATSFNETDDGNEINIQYDSEEPPPMVTNKILHLFIKKSWLHIWNKNQWNYFTNDFLSLWSGIAPSLILCVNPAIHFTVFDVIKRNYLVSRHDNSRKMDRLTMMEAFIFGIIAKFLATVITYPLIRAKVLMMVRKKNIDDSSKHNYPQQTMRKVLCHMYRYDGRIHGLYRGLTLQLLHTSLKSALLLMVKEQITSNTRQLFLGVNKTHPAN